MARLSLSWKDTVSWVAGAGVAAVYLRTERGRSPRRGGRERRDRGFGEDHSPYFVFHPLWRMGGPGEPLGCADLSREASLPSPLPQVTSFHKDSDGVVCIRRARRSPDQSVTA